MTKTENAFGYPPLFNKSITYIYLKCISLFEEWMLKQMFISKSQLVYSGWNMHIYACYYPHCSQSNNDKNEMAPYDKTYHCQRSVLMPFMSSPLKVNHLEVLSRDLWYDLYLKKTFMTWLDNRYLYPYRLGRFGDNFHSLWGPACPFSFLM